MHSKHPLPTLVGQHQLVISSRDPVLNKEFNWENKAKKKSNMRYYGNLDAQRQSAIGMLTMIKLLKVTVSLTKE